MAPKRNKVIMDEVNKLLVVDFICEVYYLDQLANVVLVKKANGKRRMCLDFTDLNKACPKDSFPIQRIDQLVDSTTGQAPYIHRCVLEIQPDQDIRIRPGEDCLHHQPGALLLQGNALWIEKYKSHLLKVSK